MSKKNYSVARVVTHTQSSIGKCERHNERKNESYANMNVDTARCDMNVHFKGCGELTYNEQLNKLIAEKKVCMRGLKVDAKVFDEMIFDVNTDYFETHGGYEYAKEFYEEAYRFAVALYGEQNIISAVMHADELNVALTEQYGKPVYHYHMHLVALPVVEKQILWTKRCKDKSLVGTVKETVNQISHSKKWKSPQAVDENGNVIFNEKGKPVLIPSYSILQDDFFNHMQRAGFNDFIRGEKGSTAEHLSCLQYEIQQDKKRLEEIKERLQTEEIKYYEIQTVNKTFLEIDSMGKKTLTGKVTISSEDFNDLSNMAKQSVAARSKIYDLELENKKLQSRIWDLQGRINRLSERLHELEQVCAPYLEALSLMPKKVKTFISDVLKTVRKEKNNKNIEIKKER
ncbi:MAG: plasmid recombination protein [Clostridia bacterium]|nr:plasmid recombination protein [Clostridia bacterium]